MSRCRVSLCTGDHTNLVLPSRNSDGTCAAPHAEIVLRNVVDLETVAALRAIVNPMKRGDALKTIPPELFTSVRAAYSRAMDHFNMPLSTWTARIKRYVPGDLHDWHVDTKPAIKFSLDYSLTLSDPDEYEGGEYETRDGTRQASYRLNPGDMLFLPSDIEHRIKTVTGGRRFVMVGVGFPPSLAKWGRR